MVAGYISQSLSFDGAKAIFRGCREGAVASDETTGRENA